MAGTSEGTNEELGFIVTMSRVLPFKDDAEAFLPFLLEIVDLFPVPMYSDCTSATSRFPLSMRYLPDWFSRCIVSLILFSLF